MYNLPYFKEKDPAVIRAFMHKHPFAVLCGCGDHNLPVATQVPLLLEERNGTLILKGHVQRKTDHQLAFEKNPDVLALFSGPHAYVSASWYPDPLTASTWNYMTVHARGRLTFLDNEALLALLAKTTALFENNDHSPALVEKMPAAYVEKMMTAIIAFEIEVTKLDHVFKLSQNRDEKTYNSIVSHLAAGSPDDKQVAAEMQSRSARLFNH